MSQKNSAYRFKKRPVEVAEGVVSAYLTSVSDSINKERHQDLVDDLIFLGYTKLKSVRGEWEGVPEIAIKVPRISESQLKHIAQRYGQDAMVWGGRVRTIRASSRLREKPIKMGGHYFPHEGITLNEVIRRWQDNNDKIRDEDMPLYFSAKELSPYRSGGKMLDPIKIASDTVIFQIGRNGISKVVAGHEKLAVAEILYDPTVAVQIEFLDRVVADPKKKNSIVDRVVERYLGK